MKSLHILLRIELHAAKVVVGKGIVGRKFYGLSQRFTGRWELLFGPPEKSQIAIGVFQKGIEPNRFLILGGSFGILARLREQYPAKIANARVFRRFTFRGGEFPEGILNSILF